MSPKKKLFEQFARVAKSLSSPNRMELLETLAQGEKSVDALAQATGMSVANTSHHLQILRDSGLAESRREGLQVIYRLSDDQIPTLMGDDLAGGVGGKHATGKASPLTPHDNIIRTNP